MIDYESCFSLCANLAQTIKNNKALNKLAQTTYDKAWTVEIGFDRLRQDWKKAAPFVVLLPQTEEVKNDGYVIYGIGLLLGVVDNIAHDNNGVRYMQGLDVLSTSAAPLLTRAISDAVDTVPGFYFTDFEREYEQESFPLIYCNMAITLTKYTPIGGRRI